MAAVGVDLMVQNFLFDHVYLVHQPMEAKFRKNLKMALYLTIEDLSKYSSHTDCPPTGPENIICFSDLSLNVLSLEQFFALDNFQVFNCVCVFNY